MARLAGNGSPDPVRDEPSSPPIDRTALDRLGLGHLAEVANDPRLLAEQLKTDDASDAQADLDEFTRGIRRAVRLRLAYAARLHRRQGMSWVSWVSANFQAGYRCYHRYHIAAEIQLELLGRGLPLLTNEHQSRVIAPLRRHERFWEAMGSFKDGFPPAHELHRKMIQTLGITLATGANSPRVRLHRILLRIVDALPATDDPSVAEAVALVRRAIGILGKGTA